MDPISHCDSHFIEAHWITSLYYWVEQNTTVLFHYSVRLDRLISNMSSFAKFSAVFVEVGCTVFALSPGCYDLSEGRSQGLLHCPHPHPAVCRRYDGFPDYREQVRHL